ncbi:Uncharacterised protein [Xylophilus ampelinus]|nr:DUF4174 domain-containing protein [Variovorax sp.]VTY39087.1 Uncharacterised protein [Xylophilus ampelinus]
MPVLPLTLAAALALPLAAGAADPNPLQAERWKTRPVVVVVPEGDDPLLRKVRATLEDAAGREAFREREMALYTVVGGHGSRNGRPLAAAQTAALLRALALDTRGPSAFVLVGKDGGVKMREGADVDLQAVFDEIDRMPMRQRR